MLQNIVVFTIRSVNFDFLLFTCILVVHIIYPDIRQMVLFS